MQSSILFDRFEQEQTDQNFLHQSAIGVPAKALPMLRGSLVVEACARKPLLSILPGVWKRLRAAWRQLESSHASPCKKVYVVALYYLVLFFV